MSKSALEKFLRSLGIEPTGDRDKDMKLAQAVVPKFKKVKK